MSLTRLLPTQSDRMAILEALAEISDAVILEYGTAGTTTYAIKTKRLRSRIFTTGMSEADVVMGDTSSLEKAIRDIDRQYSPPVIFVMASTVAAVTGSDVKGVCTYMQDEVSAKLIVFTQAGFGRDFSAGLMDCYTDLVKILATKHVNVTNTFNIIGGTAETSYIEKLLRDNFSFNLHTRLCENTSIAKISTMSTASLNLVMSYEGLKAAEILKERFGTPYVYGLPYEARQISKFLDDIAKTLSISDFVAPKVMPSNKNIPSKISAYATYDELVGIKKYAEEISAEIGVLVCSHSLKYVPNLDEDIIYIKGEKQKIAIFREQKGYTVYGADDFLRL